MLNNSRCQSLKIISIFSNTFKNINKSRAYPHSVRIVSYQSPTGRHNKFYKAGYITLVLNSFAYELNWEFLQRGGLGTHPIQKRVYVVLNKYSRVQFSFFLFAHKNTDYVWEGDKMLYKQTFFDKQYFPLIPWGKWQR